jgi:hypothetical protein
MAEQKNVKLTKRQILGEEAASWHFTFRAMEYQPGQYYWVAVTKDVQGRGPVFRVTAAKDKRELVTPEMVSERVRGELVMGEGRVKVIELKEGALTFQASFAIGFTFSVAQRVCLFTTDPERQPLTPVPSEEGIRAGMTEARARRDLARLREEGAPEAAVEEKLRETDEAGAIFKTAKEVAQAEVAGELVHPLVRKA